MYTRIKKSFAYLPVFMLLVSFGMTYLPGAGFAQITPDGPPTDSIPVTVEGDGSGWTWSGINSDGSSTNTNTKGTTNSQTSSKYCANFNGSMDLKNPNSNVGTLLMFFTCFISTAIVPLVFAIALVLFIWGVTKFIQSSDSEERAEGKQFMLWGIIALTVMLCVWGLVAILGNTFGIDTGKLPQLPESPK